MMRRMLGFCVSVAWESRRLPGPNNERPIRMRSQIAELARNEINVEMQMRREGGFMRMHSMREVESEINPSCSSPDFERMRGKSGAEAGQPKAGVVSVVPHPFFEGEEDTGAAAVSVVVENAPCFFELEPRQDRFHGIDDISSAGVGDDLVRVGAALGVKFRHRVAGNLWDTAVQFVPQFSAGIDEADLSRSSGACRVRNSPASNCPLSFFPFQMAAAAPSLKRQRLMRTPGSLSM